MILRIELNECVIQRTAPRTSGYDTSWKWSKWSHIKVCTMDVISQNQRCNRRELYLSQAPNAKPMQLERAQRVVCLDSLRCTCNDLHMYRTGAWLATEANETSVAQGAPRFSTLPQEATLFGTCAWCDPLWTVRGDAWCIDCPYAYIKTKSSLWDTKHRIHRYCAGLMCTHHNQWACKGSDARTCVDMRQYLRDSKKNVLVIWQRKKKQFRHSPFQKK